ncbi:MAG: histidine kinase [Dyadobacter sp.]
MKYSKNSTPVMDKHSQHFPVRYLMRPQTRAERIKYHSVFWLGFIAFHLLYFVGAKEKLHFSAPWIASYGLYYLRFIPVYYLSVGIFSFLKEKYYGEVLIAGTLVSMVMLMHLANVSVYGLLDKVYNLESLSDAFLHFGSMYLAPVSQRSIQDWLLLLIYDVEETQLLFLPLGLKMAKYGIRQEIQRRDLITDNLKNEISNLRLQPAPHLILNTINAAYAEVQPVSEKAAEYLENLSSVLHFTLYETADELILLHKEWEALLDFIHLEAKRFEDRLKINISQKGTVPGDKLIPPLILFTLTENAFKHGVYPALAQCQVDVSLLIISNQLTFKIYNTKPGYKYVPRKSKEFGIGLENIRKRLNYYFSDNYQMIISENPDDYQIEIKIPLLDNKTKNS